MEVPGSTHTSKGYRGYVLLILTGVYTFNFIDRQILVILQEPIKADLGLTDTQLGLLSGFAFAIFYATLGIPIARYADRSNRKNIVAISLTVWSGMTAISGFAMNYWHIFLARIGVGIGEAGGSPPAHSIISDYFPPEKRATALSIYSMGIYIGVLFGFLAGGWINHFFGWRMAFVAIGLPGILYALIVFFTVKEPTRGQYDSPVQQKEPASNLVDTVKELLSYKTFIYLGLGGALNAFQGYGVGNFMPSFLARIHSLDGATIGTWLALTAGIGGGLGVFMGGFLADKFGRKDIRWYLWIPMVAGILKLIPFSIVLLSSVTQLVLITTFFSNLLTPLYVGTSFAVTHNLVSSGKRALASAILLLILNLIGLGLGPVFFGLVSDLFEPTYNEFSLRWSFSFAYITQIFSIFFFFKAAQHYRADLNRSKNLVG